MKKGPEACQRAHLSLSDLERLFSVERLSTYIAHCGGDFAARRDVSLELSNPEDAAPVLRSAAWCNDYEVEGLAVVDL
jgi:hypothetical protein